MEKPFTIVARIVAKPGREAATATELHKLIEPSRRDAGCLEYVMHVSHENPGLFLFYENWRSREDWAAHMERPHLLAWQGVAADLTDEVEILQMEKFE